MRAEPCRDMLLEIYHLLLIDKDIYQQPKEKADGEGAEAWTATPFKI